MSEREIKNLLVTGGCGFIGTNFIRYVFHKYQDLNIVNVDKLTYAANRENLVDLEQNKRYTFVHADISSKQDMAKLFNNNKFDAVVNFAAESHVDRSISDPSTFITTNILGTEVLLELALKHKTLLFLQISTDEVYGQLGKEGSFTELTNLAPSSPYSASKASADLLALSFCKTYNLPVLITRSSNNYGPYQFPEKLIPKSIGLLLNDKPVEIYGDGSNIRDWIYVRDNCKGINCILRKGKIGEVYNIGGNNEISNLELIKKLIINLKKTENLIKFIKDRPGHDWRYALDCSKIKRELGWENEVNFEAGLDKTVKWYIENSGWLKKQLDALMRP